jgi:hypothetical protein
MMLSLEISIFFFLKNDSWTLYKNHTGCLGVEYIKMPEVGHFEFVLLAYFYKKHSNTMLILDI